MKINFLEKLKDIPIGITGLGTGLAGIGALWTIFLQEITHEKNSLAIISIIQYICIFFTILFLFLILLRNTKHKKIVKEELNHPILASFVPTISMSGSMIGGFIASISKIIGWELEINFLTIIGAIIVYLSVLSHIVFFVFFIMNILRKHNIKKDNLYASWVIPSVGMTISCTVSCYFPDEIIPIYFFQSIWFFGLVSYIIILPYMSYKLIFHRSNDIKTLPTMGVFAAPPNLLMVGFLISFIRKNENSIYETTANYYDINFVNNIVIVLGFFSFLATIIVYLLLVKIFQINFNPAYASLTFPLAISARSKLNISLYLETLTQNNIYMNNLYFITRIITYIEIAISSVIIIYVLIRYLMLIFNIYFDKNKKILE
ncbi:MAG: hypothetical protein ACRCRZ_01605 [Metamycoplasmataceae bacterium]